MSCPSCKSTNTESEISWAVSVRSVKAEILEKLIEIDLLLNDQPDFDLVSFEAQQIINLAEKGKIKTKTLRERLQFVLENAVSWYDKGECFSWRDEAAEILEIVGKVSDEDLDKEVPDDVPFNSIEFSEIE